jgi:pimeloyl-ACP methyl ester carboxylesterase
MPALNQTVTLADGRVLDVLLGGAPDGFPLLMHHGSPADSTAYLDWHDDCQDRGLRLISASRPGYANSTRQAGRDIAQAATDSLELLDLLGCGEFVAAGWSGGGPHVLACAALLGERCRAVATLAGVGPYGQADLDFTAGMGPENVDEFAAALAGEAALRPWMAEFAEPFRHVTGDQVAEAFGGLVADIDKDVLQAGYAAALATELQRALEHGVDGWVDDDLAFTSPWGFDPDDITAPVTVWQGDLDLMVPFAHGQWLARKLRTATARMVPGHGHFSLVTRYRGQILDDLLSLSAVT